MSFLLTSLFWNVSIFNHGCLSYKIYHLLSVSRSFHDDFIKYLLLSSLSNLCFFTNPSFKTICFLRHPWDFDLQLDFDLLRFPPLRQRLFAVVRFGIPCGLLNFWFFPLKQNSETHSLLNLTNNLKEFTMNEWVLHKVKMHY